MIPVLSGLAVLAVVGWMIWTRPYLLPAAFFLLFAFAWRLIDVMYIDLFGPIYAEQVLTELGPGSGSAVLAAAYLAFLLPLGFVFRRSRLEGALAARRDLGVSWQGMVTLPDVVFVFASLCVAALYLELLRSGAVPLLHGIEAFDYRANYGLVFNPLLFKYGNLFVFHLGLFYGYGRLPGDRPDKRFLVLLILVLAYSFLAGHRFSAFYSFVSFFFIPYAAVMIGNRPGKANSASVAGLRLNVITGRAKGLVILIGVLGGLVGYAVYNSYTFVRADDPAGPLDKFLHRVLVQQGEMWWLSYDRVLVRGESSPTEALNFLFVEPFDTSRNTSIQYLMLKAIGDKAREYVEGGFSYGGGFPEIYFELFGPVLAFPALLLAGWVTAELLYRLLMASILRRVATVFCTVYVLYALLVMAVGGMLNFLVAWTFWAKVAGMAVAAFLEPRLISVGLGLVPWVWLRSGPRGARAMPPARDAAAAALRYPG